MCVVIAAVVGETASALGAGSFTNGARTAAFAYLYNDYLHDNQTNSAGPNNRHALGVEEAIKADLALGFELIGRNIKVLINGEIRIYDYAIRDNLEQINIGVEVKTTIGDTIRVSTRQVNLDTELMRFGGEIVGNIGKGATTDAVGYRAFCFGCDTLDIRPFRLRQQLELYGIETKRGKLPGLYIAPR